MFCKCIIFYGFDVLVFQLYYAQLDDKEGFYLNWTSLTKGK